MKNKIKNAFGSVQFKKGTASAFLVIIIIAIVIVINVIAAKLPSTIKNIDISENHLYTIGDVTKTMLKGLNHEVDIIVLAEDENIDPRIKNILSLYNDSTDKITVSYKDPALYPSILDKYDAETNTIIVSCDDTERSQTIYLSDIVQYDEYYYYYYGQYVETSFDGEGQFTTAIDYVASDDNKAIYMLTGHSESEFGSTIEDKVKRSNFSINSLNLLTTGEIPEDCSMLIINQPENDLNDDELATIQEYMANGGKTTIILGRKSTGLTNLNTLMADYGMSIEEGYVGDADRFNSYDRSYFSCFPDYSSGDITSEFDNQKELVLVQNSLGIKTTDTDNVAFDAFLITSSNGLLYSGDENDDAKQGQYNFAVKASKTIDTGTSEMVIYGCASIVDEDLLNSYNGIKNADVFMNGITAGFEDVTNISIDPVDLQIQTNTIVNPRGVSMIFIAIIPVTLIVFGLVHWLKRRK